MLAIAVLLLYSNCYSQNKPEIEIKIINNDTLFVFNKPYANLLVNKFDSLRHFKQSFFDCADVLTDCAKVRDNYKNIVKNQDDLITNLHKQVMYGEELAKSYNNLDIYNKQLQKDLKRQYRKTKLWNGIGWGAISATILTSIFLIVK
jgi:hypothetical protein